MDSSTQTVFCCGSATLVAPRSARKHHKDPNQEVHEAIFHSFLAYAVRRQRAATLMAMVMRGIGGGILTPPESRAVTPVLIPSVSKVQLKPTPRTAQVQTPISKQISTPTPRTAQTSTPAPTRVSSPTQIPTRRLTRIPIPIPTRIPTPRPGQISTPTTQMPTPAKKPAPPTSPPPPVLTSTSLASNPLTPHTAYVLQLTSRHDFGPVYSHRYFACPPSLQHDWPEISLEQWFAAGEPFKMRADQRDLKCVGDGRFFRLVLRPNLGMRGFDDGAAAGGGGGGGDGDGNGNGRRRWRRNWWQ